MTPDPITTAPQAPDPSQVAPQAPMPATPAPAAPGLAAQQPQQPGLWKTLLTGALQGLAGSGGSTHFGSGAGHGAANVLAQQQLAIENQRAATAQQSEIKFRDAQAANSVAEAARNNATAAQMPQEAQDAHGKNQLEMAGELQNLGITPTVIADDTHDSATAGLKSLTQSQGSVPHLFNLEVGGQHLAYDLSQLSATPQGLSVVNSSRKIQGLPELTPQQWRQTPKPAQAQAAEGALKFFAPAPPKTPAEARSNFLQYKGWADAYNKRPDADPAVTQRLQGVLTNLKSIDDGLTSQEVGLKKTNAYDNAAAQKQARLDVDRQEYQSNQAAGDVTGWTPPKSAVMSEQQFNAANTKWASGPYSKAQDVEKGYQMFQNAYDDRHNATTGAQSMLALSQHLSNTFGNVKGARITKDMIQEHLGARGVSDSAQVAVQKLTNGDVLSENQWNAFHGLIGDARNQTWKDTVQQAHALGVPVKDGLLPTDVAKGTSSSPAKQTANKYSSLGAIPAN